MNARRASPTMACVLWFAGILNAQSPNASLTGSVTDVSKARIVNAEVAAVDTDTDIRHTSKTNTVGVYFLTSLSPGRYRIEVQKPGFKTLVKPDVVLHVQD